MSDSKPHSSLDELFIPRNELLDAIERRFLAKEGTPWADIEELEAQIYRGVRGLIEQLEGWKASATLNAEHCERLKEQLEAEGSKVEVLQHIVDGYPNLKEQLEASRLEVASCTQACNVAVTQAQRAEDSLRKIAHRAGGFHANESAKDASLQAITRLAKDAYPASEPKEDVNA